MGYVCIPEAPVAAGQVAVLLDLNRSELQTTVDRLKAAVAAFQASRQQQNGHPDEGHASEPSTSMQEPQSTSQAQPAPAAPCSQPSAPPHPQPPAASGPPPLPFSASAMQLPPPQQQHIPLPAPTQSVQPAPPPPAPPPAAPAFTQQQQQPQMKHRPWAPPVAEPRPGPPQPADARSSAAAAKTEVYRAWSPPVERSGGARWQVSWRTDGADHGGHAVSALAYAPRIAGLPGGDGHAGWLVSASRQLLTLWECSASAGKGEPSLQVMHQQYTETLTWGLIAEPGRSLLAAAAQDAGRGGGACVALHGLHPDMGMLSPKARLPLPPLGAAQGTTPAPPPTQHSQVVSLHGAAPALAACVGASFGASLAVYDTAAVKPGETARAKGVWPAHASHITALHRSGHAAALFSGAHDGSIHQWDLSAKPSQPVGRFRHAGAVTGLHALNGRHLLSAGMDARLLLWDVRRPSQPLRDLVSLDRSGVVKLAVSPFGESAVFATASGALAAVDLTDLACTLAHVAQLPAPIGSLIWNTATAELYAASQAAIVVLQQVL